MHHGKAILQSTRGPFLLLTPACIFLGISIAVHHGIELDWMKLVLILLGALLAHASVNLLNEYSDFRSGLDLNTTRTAFSGGSGSLPSHPGAAISVRNAGIATLVGTVLIGLYLTLKSGPGLLLIGLIGAIVIITYTDWLNRSALLCLVAPGLGFGLLMVWGTQYVLEPSFDSSAFWIALVPFCTTNNLLLLNQYPDLQADRAAGRRHLIIAYGVSAGHIAYAIQLALIALVIISGIVMGWLPFSAALGLLTFPLALVALSGAIRLGEAIGSEPKYLAMNVITALLTPTLLAAGLLISS